jgi:hypothetical protein
MAKYRFRKMYFICENKRVVAPNVHTATAHQYKDKAGEILAQRPPGTMLWNVNKPPKVYTLEGFCLVHESLFDELLKEHSK